MNTLPLLIKREYWEHRGGFLWTPVWITGVMLIFTVLGILTAEVFNSHAHVRMGVSLDELRNNISVQDFAEAGRALDMVQFTFGAVPCIGLFFVLFFYLLGALYDDRRDRSVLFWKSLPVSDGATVASKALSAMLVAPLIAFAASSAAYVVFLVIVTLWTGAHGLNVLPAIAASHPFRTFGRLLMTIPLDALWALPAIGWLMFWSAFARSKPFLWAVLLPLGALFINWWLGVLGAPNISGDIRLASILGRLLLSVVPGSWMMARENGFDGPRGWFADDGQVLANVDIGHVLTMLSSANVWIGVVAGIALLVGAVWMRGRRIEVNA
ncbi:MAG TPA: hypothetical protein VFS55_03855 [Dokdonella sp.]|nr:hypothetical protein [Dokdonella sp.]